MFKTLQRSTIIRSLGIVAAAVAIGAVGAAPASALPRVDHPKIVDPNVSFGSSWDPVLNIPNDGGRLHWNIDPNGLVTPTLSGNMFTQSSAGLRVRLRMDYLDAARNQIDLRFSLPQGPAGMGMGPPYNIINWGPLGRFDVYGVRVSTERETAPASGIYVTIASAADEMIW